MKTTSSKTEYSSIVPTVLESIFLAIYPTILLLGSLYATFHPALRTAAYLPDSQSYDPRAAPSYFAKKSNVFNVYFVKIGWLWMTAAFFLLILTHALHGPPLTPQFTRRRIQAGLRYLSVTAIWIAVTQWFFGPAIIDRSFRWTGGQCEAIFGDSFEDEVRKAEMGDVREVFTHAACKAIGGTWKGGHDISGHVFLLTLGSAMLILEVLPALMKSNGEANIQQTQLFDRSSGSGSEETQDSGSATSNWATGLGVKAVFIVAGLSWWMLLMTAVYFHTWFEKLTGSLVAFSAVFLVYFAPRGVPALRQLIGTPGI